MQWDSYKLQTRHIHTFPADKFTEKDANVASWGFQVANVMLSWTWVIPFCARRTFGQQPPKLPSFGGRDEAPIDRPHMMDPLGVRKRSLRKMLVCMNRPCHSLRRFTSMKTRLERVFLPSASIIPNEGENCNPLGWFKRGIVQVEYRQSMARL